jgi:hypothetical protein
MKKIIKIAIIAGFLAAILGACSALNTITKLKKLQFKIENVSNFQVAGIPISGKASISDLNMTNALQISQIFTQKKFPAQFVLNLAALNPNDGKTSPVKTDATISSLDGV